MRDTFREDDDEDDMDRDGKEAFAKFDEPTRIEGEGGGVDPDPGDRDSVGHTTTTYCAMNLLVNAFAFSFLRYVSCVSYVPVPEHSRASD